MALRRAVTGSAVRRAAELTTALRRPARSAPARRASSSASLAGATKSPVTEHLWRMRAEAAATQGGDSEDLTSPEHLLEKSGADSSVAITYGFTSDDALREKYANAWGYIRMGVLLEDLDALAGTVAFNHCDDANPATRPLLIVTACVDQISILRPLRMTHDIELSGQVRPLAVWSNLPEHFLSALLLGSAGELGGPLVHGDPNGGL